MEWLYKNGVLFCNYVDGTQDTYSGLTEKEAEEFIRHIETTK